jgi:hypothetical protein
MGDERTVVSDPHSRYFGTGLSGGELTPGDGARIWATDFDTWFAAQQRGAAEPFDVTGKAQARITVRESRTLRPAG